MAKQITRTEFERKMKELERLKKEGREEIAQKLQEARSHGDLSENAEYDEARNDQAKLEEQIAQLEIDLDTVEVVSDDFFQSLHRIIFLPFHFHLCVIDFHPHCHSAHFPCFLIYFLNLELLDLNSSRYNNPHLVIF